MRWQGRGGWGGGAGRRDLGSFDKPPRVVRLGPGQGLLGLLGRCSCEHAFLHSARPEKCVVQQCHSLNPTVPLITRPAAEGCNVSGSAKAVAKTSKEQAELYAKVRLRSCPIAC